MFLAPSRSDLGESLLITTLLGIPLEEPDGKTPTGTSKGIMDRRRQGIMDGRRRRSGSGRHSCGSRFGGERSGLAAGGGAGRPTALMRGVGMNTGRTEDKRDEHERTEIQSSFLLDKVRGTMGSLGAQKRKNISEIRETLKKS